MILNNWVDYNDGVLVWKQRPISHFADNGAAATWNAIYPGKVAGSVRSDGYRLLGFNNQRTLEHRVIWELFNGSIPDGMQVDHIDGDRSNNRIENLRVATIEQNRRNRKVNNDNSTGYKGVGWRSSHSKWRARIAYNKRTIHLGYFDTPEDAHRAYCEASKRLHGNFSRTN